MLRSNFFSDSGFETQLGHIQAQIFLVQQPEHDLFPVQRRHGRNAKIQFLSLSFGLVLDHDAAVLRQPLFRNVQLGHDLHTAGDRVSQLHRGIHHRLQHAVDAKPHTHFVLIRLHVNIGSSAA